MMSSGRRRPRRQRRDARVRFEGDALAPTCWQWECEPDAPHATKEVGSESANPLQGVTVNLQTADGNIFEVDGDLLCASSLIQQLVNDSIPEETIPLPNVSSQGLSLFVQICSWCAKQSNAGDSGSDLKSLVTVPGGEERQCLNEVLWAIKLLDMGRVASRAVVELIAGGCFLDSAWHHIQPDGLCMLLQHGGSILAAESLVEIIGLARAKLAPGLEPLVVDAVVPHLSHVQEAVRETCVELLQEIGTLNALLVLCRHRSFAVRHQAVKAMPHNSPDAVLQILKLATHGSFLVREAAARALGIAAPQGDIAAGRALASLLEDPTRDVREAAVTAFLKVAPRDDPAFIELLAPRISHDDWPVRCAAVRVLVDLSPSNQELIRQVAEEIKASGATLAKALGARLLQSFEVAEESCRDQCCWSSASEASSPTSSSSVPASSETRQSAGGLPKRRCWFDIED